MKAIVNCEYGVDNLQLRELEKPSPNDNEVLVRVRAASVNPVDGLVPPNLFADDRRLPLTSNIRQTYENKTHY